MTFYKLESDGAAVVVEVVIDNFPTALVTHSTPPCPSVPALLSTFLASIFLGLFPFDQLSQILLLLLQPFPLLTLLLLPLVRPVIEVEV